VPVDFSRNLAMSGYHDSVQDLTSCYVQMDGYSENNRCLFIIFGSECTKKMGKVANKHEEVCICNVWSAALSKQKIYFYKHICREVS